MSWWRLKSRLALRVGACSDKGLVRSTNQDAYGCFPTEWKDGHDEHLFIVADGMGGHARGQEASRAAVDVAQKTFFAEAGLSVEQRLTRAMEAANAHIYAMATGKEEQPPETMGTTCTMLALARRQVYLAHVGDSRAYRIRKGHVEQLTRDHTWVMEMQREGILSAVEAQDHPRRHALARALGVEPSVLADITSVGAVGSGDRFLLCSDGLAGVPSRLAQQVVLRHAPQAACEMLVQLANEQGGFDNVTVLLVYVD